MHRQATLTGLVIAALAVLAPAADAGPLAAVTVDGQWLSATVREASPREVLAALAHGVGVRIVVRGGRLRGSLPSTTAVTTPPPPDAGQARSLSKLESGRSTAPRSPATSSRPPSGRACARNSKGLSPARPAVAALFSPARRGIHRWNRWRCVSLARG
jgi:hypothetical protein